MDIYLPDPPGDSFCAGLASFLFLLWLPGNTVGKESNPKKEGKMKVWKSIKRLVQDESGISAVEYALLLALIGAGIAGAAFALGGRVQTNITDATTALTPAG